MCVFVLSPGADRIFRSDEKTITDEDIDLILSRGQEKTEEMNKKLQTTVPSLLSLSLKGDVPVSLLKKSDEEEDPEKKEAFEKLRREANAELVSKLTETGKRERKAANYNEEAYFRKV